jgi:hypothetical protein
MGTAYQKESVSGDSQDNDPCQPDSSAINTSRPEDDSQQEEFRQQYRLQMERLACPGCGEEPFA